MILFNHCVLKNITIFPSTFHSLRGKTRKSLFFCFKRNTHRFSLLHIFSVVLKRELQNSWDIENVCNNKKVNSLAVKQKREKKTENENKRKGKTYEKSKKYVCVQSFLLNFQFSTPQFSLVITKLFATWFKWNMI